MLTRSKLETLWEKTFPATMPIEIKLNENDPSYRWVRNENFGEVLDEVFEVGYVVPFLQSLQQFLSIRQVHQSVIRSFTLGNSGDETDVYSDVWDGNFIKQNPLFLEKKGQVLGFQVNMDDVELANPLGSKKEKHKVSIFYWMLLNIPPQFRSSLKNIQLLGMVSSDLLKRRGVNTFIAPFLADLKLLYNGVELNVRNDKRKWFSVSVNFAGDMPASNFMGGFKESVEFTNLPCQTCMINKSDLDNIHHNVDCVLREKPAPSCKGPIFSKIWY